MARNDGGLYEVLNLKTWKRYIGVAEFSIEARWEHHVYALEGNYHVNKHLQASWNLYGRDAFDFSVLQRCSAEDAYELEALIVDEEFIKKNYNKVLGGKGGDWGSGCEITIGDQTYPSIREAARKDRIPRRTLLRLVKKARNGETAIHQTTGLEVKIGSTPTKTQSYGSPQEKG